MQQSLQKIFIHIQLAMSYHGILKSVHSLNSFQYIYILAAAPKCPLFRKKNFKGILIERNSQYGIQNSVLWNSM